MTIMRLRISKYILFILILVSACSPNNVTINNSLKKHFDEKGVIGSFAIYDNGTGQFTIYNLARYRDTAFLPASTFKIVNSLIGIETGRIVNEKMIIKWDGTVRPFPNNDSSLSWNQDLTMEQAFKRSAVPYFQEIARRIGKDTMQFWIDSLKYGNKNMGKTVDMFWLDNSLKITADEQMGLVKKLYFNQLPFQKRTQEIVRKLMVQEENANYKLAYKTGLGYIENGRAIGWMVGWVEENRHPYFFVLNVEGDHDAPISTIRKEILKSTLKELGFLEGKR
jgi:beta-lactamase class D